MPSKYLIKTHLSNLFSNILVCFSEFQRPSAVIALFNTFPIMTEEQLYTDFIANLERIYGRFSDKQKKFKKASNSQIARDLCYSDSQFSRLINKSASNGEYERAIRNTKRAINELQLKAKVGGEAKSALPFLTRFKLGPKKVPLYSAGLVLFLLLLIVMYQLSGLGND